MTKSVLTVTGRLRIMATSNVEPGDPSFKFQQTYTFSSELQGFLLDGSAKVTMDVTIIAPKLVDVSW